MIGAVVVNGPSGSVIAGRFRVEERIGAGGMGEVYRATHLELGVSVAVKFLGPAIAGVESAVQRFRREARAAARLKSAHIVQVYDFGVHDGVPFLVMELLEGETLSERLARMGKLSLREASSLIDQASRGLAAAHAQGVVHRDVKPSNLFLAQTADGEVLKLLDFGIAKPEDGDISVTASQEVLGSPVYMSPEQARGEELDQRTDVWSLASVAFRLITGVEAFRGPNTSSVLLKICSGTPPKVSAVAPELSPELDAFFDRAFSRELSARFQNGSELAHAFARAAGTEPERLRDDNSDFFRTGATVVLARPDAGASAEERRRWQWLAFAAIALAVLATILLVRTRSARAPEARSVAPAGVQAVRTAGAPLASAALSSSTVSRAAVLAPAPPLASTPAFEPTLPRAKVAPKRARSAPKSAPAADENARDPVFGL